MNINNSFNLKSLLLSNIGVRQTIFKNTFWLIFGEGVSQLLKVFLVIYAARVLGATEYGKFIFALTFVSLLVLFSDFGLSSITTREFSKNREREKEFSAIVALKIILCLGVFVLTSGGSFFITPDPFIRKIILVLSVVVLISSFLEIIFAFFRARQKMEYEAGAKIIQSALLTGISFFVISKYPSVENLSYSYLFASLLALIFILFFFHSKVFRLRLSWNKTSWRSFLSLSWPLGLGAIFFTMYSYIDSTIMGYLGQITETGWYNAAYKIVNFTFLFPTFLSLSFYPALNIAFQKTKEKLQKIWNYQMKLIILLSFPMVMGGVVLAPKIISFFYGQEFTPSISVFQILITMAGFVFLSEPLILILVVLNQQKKICWIAISGVLFNLFLNLLLIPQFSFYGASIAVLVTRILVFFSLLYFVLKFTPIKPWNSESVLVFLISLFSATLMYLLISLPKIYILNLFILIFIGAGIYFITFFFIRNLLIKYLKIAL